jgi:hypothetical protein
MTKIRSQLDCLETIKLGLKKEKNMMDSGKYLRSAFRALKKYLELRRDENNFQQFFTTKLALF